jgi:hypothetical protein
VRLSPHTAQAFRTPNEGRGLCCLHNTCLEPSHVSVNLSPINGVPVNRPVRGRTSKCCHRRHLPYLFGWFVRLSCDERPDGSLPAFAWGDVAPTEAQPLSTSLQGSLRFFHHPLPAPLSAHLTTCFPNGRDTGLPRSA